MKILILSDYIDYGGVALASASLKNSFILRGEEVEHTSIYSLEDNLFLKTVKLKKIYSIINKYKYKHIILMHFDAIVVGIVLKLLKKNKNLIFVIHTDLVAFYNASSLLKKTILKILITLIINEKVVFVSREAKVKAESLFKFNNSEFIYNFYEIAKPIKAQETKNLGRCNFGSVSRLHSSKNIDLLIRVFNDFWLKNKHSNLIIYGNGPEEVNLKNYARNFPCASHVEFKGHVSEKHIVYSNIDALISFSDIEGFPLVILEAFSYKVPVLHSDCSSGPREIMSPESDPLIKTDYLEECSGGILVLSMKNNYGYASELNSNEGVYVVAINKLYENYLLSKNKKNLSINGFNEKYIFKKWIKVLRA